MSLRVNVGCINNIFYAKIIESINIYLFIYYSLILLFIHYTDCIGSTCTCVCDFLQLKT